MTARPSIAMQAGAVRHIVSTAPEHLRADLEAAALTLQYHADHPAVMKAVAYFLKTAPDLEAFFADNPDAQLAGFGKAGELTRGN